MQVIGKAQYSQYLYQRIFERTNIKMKGYVAVQKKLLITVYALWRNDTEFKKEFKNILQEQKHTEEKEQVLPSAVGFEKAGLTAKKVVPKKSELHKVNKPSEKSQFAPSAVIQN